MPKANKHQREQLSFLRKLQRQVLQLGLQLGPIKTGAWVLLAAWRNVLMAGNVGERVVAGQGMAQLAQRLVLGCFKALAFQAFQLNAD